MEKALGHKIPEEKAMVTVADLAKMKDEIRTHLMEIEIEPLKQKLLIAIETVHQPTDLVSPKFLPPTKEQVMQIIAPGCKDERMLSLFVETCKHLRLDPIKREIYLYKQDDTTWIIKVDYKVPVAIAQRDTDYLHFKSWVDYDEKMKNEKTNPDGITGAHCRIYKRSWVKLAHETDNPELAYKEHYIKWDTWRRIKGDGNLFKTWKEKGHFYIEKTAIDHCFRLVYSELLGSLPPSAGYEIVEEEGQTIEATVISNHKKEEYKKGKPKIDSGFFVDESQPLSPAEIQKQEQQNGGSITQNQVVDILTLLHDGTIQQKSALDYCKETFEKSAFSQLTVGEYKDLLEWVKNNAKE